MANSRETIAMNCCNPPASSINDPVTGLPASTPWEPVLVVAPLPSEDCSLHLGYLQVETTVVQTKG
jgi:hypothetical protein